MSTLNLSQLLNGTDLVLNKDRRQNRRQYMTKKKEDIAIKEIMLKLSEKELKNLWEEAFCKAIVPRKIAHLRIVSPKEFQVLRRTESKVKAVCQGLAILITLNWTTLEVLLRVKLRVETRCRRARRLRVETRCRRARRLRVETRCRRARRLRVKAKRERRVRVKVRVSMRARATVWARERKVR